MRPRTACIAALVVVVAALAAWRASCVLAGPDIDTDAYAHHMIARAILADPRDLAVHWVWLPLFHYLQVPLVALGGTMDDVRWGNVVASAALPVMVFVYVRRTIDLRTAGSASALRTPGSAAPSADATALLAAVLAAACPIAMQMGTTAQPEPLFAITMFCVATAFQAQRYYATAAWLAAGVLLRYEAWAALAVISAVVFLPALRARIGRASARRGHDEGPAAPAAGGAWVAVAVPAALILAWAALRRPVDGSWFGFLSQTRAFANDATHERFALDGGLPGLVRDALYYPVLVPARLMGPAIALVPFGVARTVREQGSRFVIVLLACLAFVSLSWVTRSSLGLDRHFVVDVPLYAIFAAQGTATIGDRLGEWLSRAAVGHMPLGKAVASAPAGKAIASALAIVSVVGLGIALDRWMTDWLGSIRRGWPERLAIGAYLRSVPSKSPIFCDEATVEILSGLDRRRFDRHWIDDPATWPMVQQSANRGGVAYVATWSRKLRGHDGVGSIVFHSGQLPQDATSGLAVLRVTGDAGRASR